MVAMWVQVVFLTAPLPLSKEAALFHLAGVEERDMCVFGDDTSRANIAYGVAEYGKDGEDGQVRETVEVLKEQKPRTRPNHRLIQERRKGNFVGD